MGPKPRAILMESCPTGAAAPTTCHGKISDYQLLTWSYCVFGLLVEAQRKAKNFHGKISDYQLLIFDLSFSDYLWKPKEERRIS